MKKDKNRFTGITALLRIINPRRADRFRIGTAEPRIRPLLLLSLGLLFWSVAAIAQTPTLGSYPSANVTAGRNTTAAATTVCSAGGFAGGTDVAVSTTPISVAVGDFNGDGKQDLAVAEYLNAGTVAIRLGDGSGGFTGTSSVAVGNFPTSVAAGDFNGDGKLDFATANKNSDNVSIRLGNGSGLFTSSTDVAVGEEPEFVAVGDFNGDGRRDLVVANTISDNVSIVLGNGSGGFGSATNMMTGDLPRSIAIDDFNGDGKQDLAVANGNSRNVSIHLGNGMGGFTNNGTVSVGIQPSSVAAGDFNGDGRQDLVVANSVSDNVSVLIGNGSGGFTSGTDVAVGDYPRSVTVGDFNGDGKPDFVTTSFVFAGKVDIHLGIGGGGFTGSTSVAVGLYPSSVAVGDFNGDNKQDLAATNTSSMNVSILLGVANDINLRGNGVNIADGDNTPATSDHTDFGATTGAPITRTFTIQNTGMEVLNLATGAITISGPDASLFSVGNIALPAAISGPSGSITFDVTYTPLAPGVHTATVKIASDDCDEAIYDFAIKGERTCVPPAFTACPAATTVELNTPSDGCAATATYNVAANGSPAPALTYTFAGATTGSGNGTGSGSTFNKGNTTVTVTATNTCGAPTCVFSVAVTDNQSPTIACPGNQQVSGALNGNACQAMASGANAEYGDNCSNFSLGYALSGAMTGSGNGQVSGLSFPVGQTTVVYTVTDAAQLRASCSFTVTVLPCQTAFSGRIIWKQDNVTGVKDVNVAIGGDQTGSTTSNTTGHYNLILLVGNNFTITPTKNTNQLNGVNAQDVSRIQQHLNGNPITNPWQLIAADVNSNNAISALDASIIQLSLLGNTSALQQFVKSWRFVPTAHALTNPPWGFPEKITITGATGDQTGKDFYGIKVGDVASIYANPANGGTGAPFVLRTPDQVLEAGRTLSVEFAADVLSDIAALQFALRFDPTQLQLSNIATLNGLPLSGDNFGTYEADAGSVRMVWAGLSPVALKQTAPVFRLTFTVLESGGRLSEVLGLDDETLPGHVYNSRSAESGVSLRFDASTAVGNLLGNGQVQLLQNRPNPFVHDTRIGFILPESCEAQLSIFDAAGRLVTERTQQYPAGRHDESFDLSGVSGLLYYELTTPFGVLAKKMTKVE